jgi:hypothetical protein
MSLYFIAVGGLVLVLVCLAMLVAGWELLLERDAQRRLRRDRQAFAASSPLPLAEPGSETGARRAALAGALAVMSAAPAAAAARREANWIETRPMVISRAPAFDDDTAPHRYDEVDLPLG